MARTAGFSDTRAEVFRILGKMQFRSGRAVVKFILCLVAAIAIAVVPPYPELHEAARWTLGIVLFCGLLWMTEALPAFAVALLAIGLQIAILGRPGGVLTPEGDTDGWEKFVDPWASPPMWLFFGGFVLARAAARTGLDRSMASHLLALAGARPAGVLLVAMLTTFSFSMFLSNTATSAMMLAILAPMLPREGGEKAARSMTLGVAFAANIGGMGTIIGTPPNAIASGLLLELKPVDFLHWMAFGLPPATLLVIGLWIALAGSVRGAEFRLHRGRQAGEDPSALPAHEPGHRVPRWQRYFVILVFLLTIGLWLTGGWHHIPTAVVSFVPIVLLSMSGVIRAIDMRSLDWDILILLAGGLSIGVGVSESGLASWIASRISDLEIPVWTLALLFGYLTLLLSNFMSNTAASNILIPVGLAAGLKAGGSDEAASFAIAMGLSASIAMALPISTPPNAIAYAGERLRSSDFLVPGTIVGIVGVPLVVFWTRFVVHLS